MLPVPANWATQLAAPTQSFSAHCNVLRNGSLVSDYPVEKISVTVNRNASQRRTCKVTITQQPDLIEPLSSWTSPIAPAGNELRPWFVVNFPDGSSAEVPLCTAPIITTTATDSGADLTCEIEGSDRSWLMSKSKLVAPFVVTPGSTISAAIIQVANQAWQGRGSLPMAISPTGATIPSTGWTAKAGKDYWSSIQELAAAAGFEVFFDVWGTLVAQPVIDPSNNAPVWGVGALFNGAVLAALKASRDGVYSEVGVVGTGAVQETDKSGNLVTVQKAFYVSEQVTDPNSPIYADGPFGVVSDLNRNATITTAVQGQTIAQTELNLQQGNFGALTLTTLPNLALDVDDVVSVNVPRLGVSGNYIIDGWTCDISPTGTTMNPTVRPVGSSG